jgi:hypothetical protein
VNAPHDRTKPFLAELVLATLQHAGGSFSSPIALTVVADP